MEAKAWQGYQIGDIQEMANIESHTVFLHELLKQYKWESHVREKVISDLAFIDKKKNDKNLNLSIIGEFSSGKSTFINALLRDCLLEADIIQGTTVATTIIRYAPQYAVIVNYKDGSQEIFNQEDTDSIKAYIKELTTNDKVAVKIKEVIIEHPAAALHEGISIIDTPGTNSVERWHEDITKEAIRAVSDVSIIITSAEKPLPDTLNTFVKQNLHDVLEHCIFVVTKMDLVREKERERQLSYIKQKITSEFNLAEPVVFPYTPLYVLEQATLGSETNNTHKNDYSGLVEQSYQTEGQIYSKLLERRIIIQCMRLLQSIKAIFSTLQLQMKNKIADNKRKIQEIENAKIKDVDLYLNIQFKTSQSGYMSEGSSIRTAALYTLEQALNYNKNDLLSVFDRLLTRDTVTNFVRALPARLQRYSDEQLPTIFSSMVDRLYDAVNRHVQTAFKNFKQQYSRLAITSGHVALTDITFNANLDLKHGIIYREGLNKILENEKILSDVSKYVPLVESFAGFYNKFKFNSIKADYRNKIIALMDNFISASKSRLDKVFAEYNEAVVLHMKNLILQFRSEYEGLIAKINEDDRLRQAELSSYCAKIERSLSELTARSENIDRMQKRILQM